MFFGKKSENTEIFLGKKSENTEMFGLDEAFGEGKVDDFEHRFHPEFAIK